MPGEVTLISPAFAGLGEFAGVGATTATADASGNFTTTVTLSPSVAPGTYDITGRCGGGNLGVGATLTVAPTPVNILGIKGAGETGTIAATPAVVNAVVDALGGLGVDHIETMPLTAERVWKTIQAARAKK